jgi:hypothetical protein
MPQGVPADKETASGAVGQFEVLGLATRSRETGIYIQAIASRSRKIAADIQEMAQTFGKLAATPAAPLPGRIAD